MITCNSTQVSAIAFREFSAATVGWSLSSEYVTVDLMAKTIITPLDIQRIEDLVNEEIRNGTSVTWSIHSKDEIHNGIANLRGAPKGTALGLSNLRLVKIAGMDANPCGGTHLQTTAEIQVFKIIGIEKDRGSTRIRYVAGDRAMQYFSRCLIQESKINILTSSTPPNHIPFIEKLMKEKKDGARQMKILSDEIAEFQAKHLVEKLLNNNSSINLSSDESLGASEAPQVLLYHRHGADLAFLTAVADGISAGARDSRRLFFVFLSGDSLPVSLNLSTEAAGKSKGAKAAAKSAPVVDDSSCPFVILASSNDLLDIGFKAEVCSALQGKGGGPAGRLQGQAPALDAACREQLRRLLEQRIHSLRTCCL